MYIIQFHILVDTMTQNLILLPLVLKKIFYNTFIEAEKEKAEYCFSHPGFDKKVMFVSVLTALSLTMISYLGHYSFVRTLLMESDSISFVKKTDGVIFDHSSNLMDLSYWVCILVFFYFIIPALTIKLIFKENFSDYGLKWKGAFKDYHLYVIMLLVMIPLVIYFSSTKSFQERYPFLNVSDTKVLATQLWKWEMMYCLQFFALEFFFRGFVLFGLKKRVGFYAVFIMTIPYCMIHFGKPMPETIAAIAAGIVLGCMALKNKSVYLGFLIHVSVGLGMDIAALWQKGFFH